ncbi:MAG: fibronectin type III domain-containing protein [Deltaproteobacteria bacterium]|nr:fibronectin type III domain-containing protein [Deltaproteobacteria bacterium]
MKDSLVKNVICNFSRLDEKMKDNKKSNSSKRKKLFNKKFNRLTPFLFFLCLILMLPVIAQAASITITWDRNQEPDIAGYRIYYGTRSGQYKNSMIVYDSATQPLQLSYTVAGLSEGTTYYFALKTFDQAGQESDYSVETSQNIPGDDVMMVIPGGTTGMDAKIISKSAKWTSITTGKQSN